MYAHVIEQIKNAGVVGAGGAGFPSHIKLAAEAEYVIVNGAECEPLIQVDQQLMSSQAEQMVTGLEKVMQITGARRGFIALKGKYKSAISTLGKHIQGKAIEIVVLDDFYPAGDEQVTVYEVVKRVVPPGGIPLKVGCIVTNVETLVNIARSLEGQAVTDTYLTIIGDVPNPMTVKLPIGTRVQEAVALAGRSDLVGMKVIDGGPMMGKIVDSHLQPVTKTTKALLVLPENHPLIKLKTNPIKNIVRQAKSACVQCQRCTDMCPRFLLGHKLEPHKIMRCLNYANAEGDILKMALLCSECGACEHACPMFLSPRMVNARVKRELIQKGIRPAAPAEDPRANTLREGRKIPTKRLKVRLGLAKYDGQAPLTETSYQPQVVKIPLAQHIGKPSIPVVNIGQRVEKGMLVAAIAENSLGANIHASISGTVIEISNYIVVSSDKEGN